MNVVPATLVGLALLSAGCAAAEPAAKPAAATEAAVDPVKLDLARKLFDANGGEQQLRARMVALYKTIMDKMAEASPELDAKALASGYDMVTDSMDFYIHPMYEATVKAYARVYTEQELRDLLAFRMSPTGQAAAKKGPLITQEVAAETAPIMHEALPKMMAKMVDKVCDEQKCSPEVRRQMQAKMAATPTS